MGPRAGTTDAITVMLALAVVGLLTVGGSARTPASDAAPPPRERFAHGAAGTARNGTGGEIAPSPTMASWPGTGAGGNGGPFAFIGAQYGSLWSIPAGPNNSLGVGYCVMEDVGGEGVVAARPDPAAWDAGEMARAAALMATFGGDRVVPYGIDASGAYDLASGEWNQPSLFGGGEYTRRRQVAVNFGVKMLLDDVSPSGSAAGRKLARDTAVVNGTGGEFSALRNGYAIAQRLANVAEAQHAVGGVRAQVEWLTPDGRPPTTPGTHPVEVRTTDSTGKAVGYVPVVQLSASGIGTARSIGAVAVVDNRADTEDDTARWQAAHAAGWPTWDMAGSLVDDHRFALGRSPLAADVTDAAGVARFDVTVDGSDWELGLHTQAPTADVTLYSGTGVQGQVTWGAVPQSASVHEAGVVPDTTQPPTTAPSTTAAPATPPATAAPTTTPTTTPATTVVPTTTTPPTASTTASTTTSTPTTTAPATTTAATTTIAPAGTVAVPVPTTRPSTTAAVAVPATPTTIASTTAPATSLPATTSPPSPPPPPSQSPPPSAPRPSTLARTGREATTTLATSAAALVLAGVGLTLASRGPDRRGRPPRPGERTGS